MSRQPQVIDCIYKQTPSGPLYLRVYPAKAPYAGNETGECPWSLLIHGGGFLHGAHTSPYWWHLTPFVDRGVHVVSIAYRFAPHVSYEDIVQDCLDAHSWCTESLSEVLCRHGCLLVDIGRHFLMGESAGATLALTLGHLVRLRPRCIIDCYGLIDFTESHPFPSIQLPIDPTVATEDEIMREVANLDLSRAASWCPGEICSMRDAELQTRHCSEEVLFVGYERARLQFEIFKYLFPRHQMTSTLFRHRSQGCPEAHQALSRDHSVINMVTRDFPPTFILHGTNDMCVSSRQSIRLAERLRDLGVAVVETYILGADHCMDQAWTGYSHTAYRKYALPIIEAVEDLLQ